MISPFQLSEKIQTANLLWEDSNWISEERYSGYRCFFNLLELKNKLHVLNYKYYGNELKDISNYFPFFSEVRTSCPNTELDILLIAPPNENKQYLTSLFLNGPLGAEKIQNAHGNVEMVFLDVFTYKNTNLIDLPWKERRVYLEAVFNEIYSHFDQNQAHLALSKPAYSYKREYFNWLVENKAKGVILKDKTAPYVRGFSRNWLEVKNVNGFKENISLKEQWKQDNGNEGFDYDFYIASKTLDNIKLD